MTKKDSSLLSSEHVPMIGCFVAGFVVSRLMNHQDIVTDVVEGQDKGLDPAVPPPPDNSWGAGTVIFIIIICIIGWWVVSELTRLVLAEYYSP